MAENYISQYYTWATGNVITAARLNGNVQNFTDGLSGGVKTINIGKLMINNSDFITGSLELILNKITIGNVVIDQNKNAFDTFTKTAASTGTTVITIALGDNSGAIVEVFGSGLKGASIAQYYGKWSIYRTTGTTTINKIDDEIVDGGDLGGYFEIEQSSNDAVIKAYTDSGSWVVTGHYKIITSSTVTIS